MEYCCVADPFQYLKCNKCGVIFIDPVPRDRLKVIYPANYYSYSEAQSSYLYRIKAYFDKRFFGAVTKQIPGRSLKALDIGGGSGGQLDVLRKADSRISCTYVVDLDPKAEVFARNNGHEYFLGRIEDFSSDEKFDLILLFNLIEHLENPLEVLMKCRSLLSDRGILVLQTPNIDSLDMHLFRHRDWGGYHCPRHWILFNESNLMATVSKAGFVTLSVKFTQAASFWALSVLFFLRSIRLTTITKERPGMAHPLFGLLAVCFAGFDFFRLKIGAKTSQMILIARSG